MVANQIGRLRMWIRMRRRHCFAMELSCTGGRVAIDRGKLVLGIIVKWVLETLLDIAAAFGLVFNVPSGGAPQRFLRRQRIAISELLLDLEQIEQLVMGSYFETDAAGGIGGLRGEVEYLQLVI